jgi:C4-dicarboxylate-specific signal transduction histidine kinase
MRELLDFARAPRGQRERVDVAEVAREICELLAAERRDPPIRFELEASEAVPAACADRALVSQILFNLVRNAIDALAGRADACLRVRVGTAWSERR